MRPHPQTLIRRVTRSTDHNGSRALPQQGYPASRSIQSLLSQPTWSVRSLLPPSAAGNPRTAGEPKLPTTSRTSNPASPTAESDPDEITPSKLHHLLRLSALPLPQDDEEEAKMLRTLRDQVHFVRAIQAVDTTGVEPLVTLRDETKEAIEEQTVTLDKMMPYLELEEKVGPNGTVRRRDVVRSEEDDRQERATWEIDVADLGAGSETRRRGRFFYVKRGKEKSSN